MLLLDLKGRLHSLDARLATQSKELDHMRERLRQAEADRNEAVLRTRWLEEQREEVEGRQWTTPHVSRRSIDEVSVVKCMWHLCGAPNGVPVNTCVA